MGNCSVFTGMILLLFQAAIGRCRSQMLEPDGPQCNSRFDYEYKVVQKIVALENKCTELQEANEGLRTEIGNLKTSLEVFSSTPDQQRVPTVTFLACLNQQRLSVDSNAIVVFDTIVTDIGGGYSVSDGRFRAPYSGIYMFSASIMADNGGEVWTHFLRNEEVVAHVYARASDGRHDQGSNTVILQLKKGDTVCVQNYAKTIIYGERYSTFSGTLLRQINDS